MLVSFIDTASSHEANFCKHELPEVCVVIFGGRSEVQSPCRRIWVGVSRFCRRASCGDYLPLMAWLLRSQLRSASPV